MKEWTLETLIDFLKGFYLKKGGAETFDRARLKMIVTEYGDDEPELRGLEALIDRLEGHLKKGGAETFDRARLKMIVTEFVISYRTGRHIAESPASFLHQLAEPLKRVIEILAAEPNTDDVLIALGAPPIGLEPDVAAVREATREAARRYNDLFDSLLAINRALPSPPEKNPPHRPAKTDDLYALVAGLAYYWESFTGECFTQNWHREGGELQAATNAAAFVYEVVRYVDPDALPSLRKGAEAVVRRLRNSRK
jgi:hypothetical protein